MGSIEALRAVTTTLLDNTYLSDVELVLPQGEVVPAHKIILSAIPFFEKAFKSGMRDKDRIQLVEECFNVKADVLTCLTPLYTLSDCSSFLTQENVLVLRDMSRFLGFEGMINSTLEFITTSITHMSVDRYISYATYAELVETSKKKRKADSQDSAPTIALQVRDESLFTTLKQRLCDITKPLCHAIIKEDLVVSPETMLVVVNEDYLNVSELELLKAILKVQQQWEMEDTDKRTLLYKLLDKIDFGRCVKDHNPTSTLLALIEDAGFGDDAKVLRYIVGAPEKEPTAKKSRHIFKLALTPATNLLPSDCWYEFEKHVAQYITAPLNFTLKYQASTARFKAKKFKNMIQETTQGFILAKILNSHIDVVATYLHFGEPLGMRQHANNGEALPIVTAAIILFQHDGKVTVLYPSTDPFKQRDRFICTHDPSIAMGSNDGRPHRDYYLKNSLRKLVLYPGGSFVSEDQNLNNQLYNLEVADIELFVQNK